MELTAFQKIMEVIGTVVDGIGVCIVVGGALYSLVMFIAEKHPQTERYTLFRQHVGKSILLGLEFLVAGDIIRTVVVAPTLQNVIVLSIIVIIRTFLSLTLELELEGRWPWQKKST